MTENEGVKPLVMGLCGMYPLGHAVQFQLTLRQDERLRA